MRRCLTTSETLVVLKELHEGMAKGHFITNIIVKKILDVGYWWPIYSRILTNFAKAVIVVRKLED